MGKTIAEKLTEIKNETGFSNQKLADLSGVPVGTVNKVLSGSTEKPSFEAVAAMMSAMHGNRQIAKRLSRRFWGLTGSHKECIQ